jgi:RimJ/RimL family protein N-acetyltransferase
VALEGTTNDRRDWPMEHPMTNSTRGTDHGFSLLLVLRNGTPVTIRVMRPDDRERLATAFSKLERESIYVRFFSFRKEIPERALDRIAEIDFQNLLGLVATVGEGADETVIGSSTYVANPVTDGVRSAEVAFTIEEDYQGQGLGGRLFEAAASIARRHGISRFTADVLASNAAMLKVFERSGLPMRKRREGTTIHVELDLGTGAA